MPKTAGPVVALVTLHPRGARVQQGGYCSLSLTPAYSVRLNNPGNSASTYWTFPTPGFSNSLPSLLCPPSAPGSPPPRPGPAPPARRQAPGALPGNHPRNINFNAGGSEKEFVRHTLCGHLSRPLLAHAGDTFPHRRRHLHVSRGAWRTHRVGSTLGASPLPVNQWWQAGESTHL